MATCSLSWLTLAHPHSPAVLLRKTACYPSAGPRPLAISRGVGKALLYPARKVRTYDHIWREKAANSYALEYKQSLLSSARYPFR